HHFFSTILSHLVPVCAAISFLRSPTVSSELVHVLRYLHFTRTFLPSLSLQVISII
ncbi:unnamed protein product, partial [Ixodes pacificus]